MDEAVTNATQEAAEMFKTKWCPFLGKPCAEYMCWGFRELRGPWAEYKQVTDDKGMTSEVKTGKVAIGRKVQCEFNVFEPMVVELQPTDDYKVDEHGNVIGPDGKAVKDDFDPVEEAAKMAANRIKPLSIL